MPCYVWDNIKCVFSLENVNQKLSERSSDAILLMPLICCSNTYMLYWNYQVKSLNDYGTVASSIKNQCDIQYSTWPFVRIKMYCEKLISSTLLYFPLMNVLLFTTGYPHTCILTIIISEKMGGLGRDFGREASI